MTVHEAIDWLKVASAPFHNKDKRTEAINTAIRCMEELEQYRALGTVEELKEAREKQVAKKPIEQATDEKCHYKCECGNILLTEYKNNYRRIGAKYKFCEKCGQALKWGEEDD